MIGSLLIITGGLVLFALGAERIVRSSDAMVRRLGFTPFFYALTVVALATSLPELVVNSAHAVRGNYSLVVDDVYGSMVFNILAVLGLMATLQSLVVDRESVQKIAPVLFLTLVLLPPLISDLQINRLEGVLLLVLLVSLTSYFGRHGLAGVLRMKQAQTPDLQQAPRRALLKLTGGLVALLAGSALLVLGTDSLGDSTGLFVESNARIMGVLVLGISTSLPELVTVIIGTIRKQGELVFGTLVGSCAVNLLVGLGAPAVVADGILINRDFLRIDFPFLMLVSLSVMPLAHMKRPFDRIIGVLYLLGYLAFLAGAFAGLATPVFPMIGIAGVAFFILVFAPERFRRFPELLHIRAFFTPATDPPESSE